jgi:adenylate cyclase
MERRLAAILAADLVGYTRLMGADEAGTLRRLTELRQRVLEPLIAKHHGRVVKLMGDGMLVEFSSVVDAATCAMAWQTNVAEEEVETDEVERLRFRIGINLGDVIVDGEDIHGDGVNIAARLEGLARPGSICLSADAYRQVKGKIEAEFEDLGERNLKNMAEPVRAYLIGTDGSVVTALSALADELPLPDKPSIAVLPFNNMSGDPEQEYFADGITEDIITVLSKFRTFSVAARNSTFVYKGEAIDIKQLSDELGVRYVIEGSVRKSGNRARITAQLIDAENGDHVWAERYDRELQDIFVVQDEITECVVAAIAPEVMAAEIQRAQRKDVRHLGTWDSIMRARWHLMRFSEEDNSTAKRLLRQATEFDPNNVVAWSDLAWGHLFDFSFGWSESVPKSLELAAAAAAKAIALDRSDGRAWTAHGIVALFSDNHDDALDSLRKSIGFNPNDPLARGYLGLTLAFAGDGDAALPYFADAIRLSPRDHFIIIWFIGGAWASFVEERFVEALEWLDKARRENPQFPDVYTLLAASHVLLDQMAPARAAADELSRILPGLTLGDARLVRPLKRGEDHDRLMSGLRRAGIPE